MRNAIAWKKNKWKSEYSEDRKSKHIVQYNAIVHKTATDEIVKLNSITGSEDLFPLLQSQKALFKAKLYILVFILAQFALYCIPIWIYLTETAPIVHKRLWIPTQINLENCNDENSEENLCQLDYELF